MVIPVPLPFVGVGVGSGLGTGVGVGEGVAATVASAEMPDVYPGSTQRPVMRAVVPSIRTSPVRVTSPSAVVLPLSVKAAERLFSARVMLPDHLRLCSSTPKS